MHANPSTAHPCAPTEDENSYLADLSALETELTNATFKPLFTREQVMAFEANQQKARDSRRRMALFVLCLSEKRMHLLAQNNLPTFTQTLEQVCTFVDDSKAQLDLAETARNRLMLVGCDYEGGEV